MIYTRCIEERGKIASLDLLAKLSWKLSDVLSK